MVIFLLPSLAATAGGPAAGAARGHVGVGRRVLGADLDAVGLVVDVEDALLDLVVDLPRRVDERLLHVRRRLRGGLQGAAIGLVHVLYVHIMYT